MTTAASPENHRDVVIERLAVAVARLEEALEVLADEIESEKIGLAYRDRDKPGRGNQGDDREPRHRRGSAGSRRAIRPSVKRKMPPARIGIAIAIGPLVSTPSAIATYIEPPPCAAARPLEIKGEERDDEGRGEQHVGGQHLRHQGVERASRENRRGEDSLPRAEDAPGEEIDRAYPDHRGAALVKRAANSSTPQSAHRAAP